MEGLDIWWILLTRVTVGVCSSSELLGLCASREIIHRPRGKLELVELKLLVLKMVLLIKQTFSC